MKSWMLNILKDVPKIQKASSGVSVNFEDQL
jgi:hypothetical protein